MLRHGALVPRVQVSRQDRDALEYVLRADLWATVRRHVPSVDLRGQTVDRLLEWASTADHAQPPLRGVEAQCRDALERLWRGIICDDPVQPQCTESVTWVDLDTGARHVTRRVVDSVNADRVPSDPQP